MHQDKNKNLYKKKWRDIARREFIEKKKKKKENISLVHPNIFCKVLGRVSIISKTRC